MISKNFFREKAKVIFYWWHYTRVQAEQKVRSENNLHQNPSVNLAKLLFVTGFDKSGTTWLKHLLHDHPEINCHSSGQFFNFYSPGIHFLNVPGGYKIMAQEILNSNWYKASGHVWIPEDSVYLMSRQLISNSMLGFGQGKNKFNADKSTVQDCPLIRELFPDAPVIAIMRDGRDVAVSFAFQFLRKGNENKFVAENKLNPDYLSKVSESWAIYNKHLLKLSESNEANFFLVKYEDLLAHTEEYLDKIIEFLDLKTDSKIIEKMVKNNQFKVLSGGRRSGEADNQSFFRKGIAGDWKNYFDQDDLDIFMEQAGDVMEQAGYSA